MDKINHFEQVIIKTLNEYSERLSGNREVKIQTIFDKENKRYLVQSLGWLNDQRIYSILVQFDIIEDKIWLQHNSTEEEFISSLEKQGITKKEIVLGFFPPDERELTDFGY